MNQESGHEPGQTSAHDALTGSRLSRLLILLAGIIAGQAILYGPSLVGQKILLPLDILSQRKMYFPQPPGSPGQWSFNFVLTDLVLGFEPDRRFAVQELQAGRLPLWNPNQYAGSPFIDPKYSPFLLLTFLTKSPVILAWAQLAAALVAGTGIYVFGRRVLGVGFWPAAVIAWCYPMTGFFVFWLGYATCAAVYWLPWILWAVDCVVRRNNSAPPVGLAIATGLVLVSGHIDVAAQVLLVSGLFGLWRIWDIHHGDNIVSKALKRAALLCAGWSLGILLAAPHVMPMMDYTQTSYRALKRAGDREERPPVGPAALPLLALPHVYGSTEHGSFDMFPENQGNLLESVATGYAGMLALLLASPLAWSGRRHRSMTVFLTALGVFGLAWSLNIPGAVHLLRLPGLKMMSHNRLVFLTAFGILALAAVGLENLMRGQIKWRKGHWVPPLILVGVLTFCTCRIICLPEPLHSRLELAVQAGKGAAWIRTLDDLHDAKSWFVQYYVWSATLAAAGVAGWLAIRLRPSNHSRLFPLMAVVLVGDLLWFAHGRNPQTDPVLYYPTIPALRALTNAPPGRVIGYDCLPAKLAQMAGLSDIRGYDGADPLELLALLVSAADKTTPVLSYAMLQWLVPRVQIVPPDAVRLPPVLDMLGVRYVIFRGEPPATIQPFSRSDDYWTMENPRALPRAFVPRSVVVESDDLKRLKKLGAADFDPRKVAYLEMPVELPAECRGNARIIDEIPTRVTISTQMETPGLVVLADRWDKGWNASLDGRLVPILRANHAVRGVVVPAGSATLEFRYEPASVALGQGLSATAAAILLLWIVMQRRQNRIESQMREQSI